MTIKQALNLHEDSAVLLAFVLQKNKAWLYANQDKRLSHILYSKFHILIRRRANHWPMAYLTGHKEFFGYDFKITPDVLVPRPETELLVELAILYSKFYIPHSIIDIGTGSGNIIISIVKKLAEYYRLVYDTTYFYAIDSSKKALALAKSNAKKYGVLKKIKFLKGNLLDSLLHLPRLAFARTKRALMRGRKSGGHSVIIANLPYLTDKQYRANPDLHREPRSALVGGRDGMKYFRNLFKQISTVIATPHLMRGKQSRGIATGSRPRDDISTVVLLEHDPAQKAKLELLAKRHFPNARLKFYKDLANFWRVLEIKI